MPRRVGDPLVHRARWTAYAIGQLPVQRRLPFRSRAAITRQQHRRVRAAVAFAYAHVPYYRETMDRLALRPQQFRTAADLAMLPLIERDQVQRDPERFLSTALGRDRYVLLATEGSTGAPVMVWHDPFALFQGVAHFERGEAVAWRLARRRLVMRRVLLGFSTDAVARTRGAVHRRSVIPAGVRYRELHLSMTDDLAHNTERMLRFAADEVRGYGSYLEALFLRLHCEHGTAGLPRVVVYGGDSMSARTRRMITDELGIPVLSEYGAGEGHHLAFECEAHSGLHVNEDLYAMRIVDSDGRETADGTPGQVALSNLVNRGTVLLNYLLGDIVRRLDTTCPCGRRLPLISRPEGRTDEWLRSAEGEIIHGQEVRGLLLADDSFLQGFQVIQEAAQEFSVAVITREGCDREAFRAGVQARFAGRFGPDTRTRVSFVEELARTPAGKLRPIVSRADSLGPPPAAA